MRRFVGIEIGGTKLQLVVGDERGKIGERFRFAVDAGRGASGIQQQIREGLSQIDLDPVAGIGIGFGGPVDRRSGRVLTSYQVAGWGDFSIREWLEDLARVPVYIDNDANVAALGESVHGAGKDVQRVFYVTLGSGVGAGLVIDREIYHGGGPTEAEFGHLRLDKSGRTVESSCSGWAVDAKIDKYAKEHPDSVLASLTHAYVRGQARALLPALQQGDRASAEIFGAAADDLAFALSHVVHLLYPDVIILGGGLSLIGEPLRKEVEQRLPLYLMDVLRPGTSIRLSSLNEDAVPVGALSLAIDKSL